MQKIPKFTLCEVGLDHVDKKDLDGGPQVQNLKGQLWRRYILSVEGLDCEIVETFPDRNVFVEGLSSSDAIVETKSTKLGSSAGYLPSV